MWEWPGESWFEIQISPIILWEQKLVCYTLSVSLGHYFDDISEFSVDITGRSRGTNVSWSYLGLLKSGVLFSRVREALVDIGAGLSFPANVLLRPDPASAISSWGNKGSSKLLVRYGTKNNIMLSLVWVRRFEVVGLSNHSPSLLLVSLNCQTMAKEVRRKTSNLSWQMEILRQYGRHSVLPSRSLLPQSHHSLFNPLKMSYNDT